MQTVFSYGHFTLSYGQLRVELANRGHGKDPGETWGN